MRKILFSLVLVMCVCVLAGCGKSNELVGTWEGETTDGMKTTFVFKSGDKVEYSNEFGIKSNGTYKIKDDTVTINLEAWDKEKVYKFSVNDNTLKLSATDAYSPSYNNLTKK